MISWLEIATVSDTNCTTQKSTQTFSDNRDTSFVQNLTSSITATYGITSETHGHSRGHSENSFGRSSGYSEGGTTSGVHSTVGSASGYFSFGITSVQTISDSRVGSNYGIESDFTAYHSNTFSYISIAYSSFSQEFTILAGGYSTSRFTTFESSMATRGYSGFSNSWYDEPGWNALTQNDSNSRNYLRTSQFARDANGATTQGGTSSFYTSAITESGTFNGIPTTIISDGLTNTVIPTASTNTTPNPYTAFKQTTTLETLTEEYYTTKTQELSSTYSFYDEVESSEVQETVTYSAIDLDYENPSTRTLSYIATTNDGTISLSGRTIGLRRYVADLGYLLVYATADPDSTSIAVANFANSVDNLGYLHEPNYDQTVDVLNSVQIPNTFQSVASYNDRVTYTLTRDFLSGKTVTLTRANSQLFGSPENTYTAMVSEIQTTTQSAISGQSSGSTQGFFTFNRPFTLVKSTTTNTTVLARLEHPESYETVLLRTVTTESYSTTYPGVTFNNSSETTSNGISSQTNTGTTNITNSGETASGSTVTRYETTNETRATTSSRSSGSSISNYYGEHRVTLRWPFLGGGLGGALSLYVPNYVEQAFVPLQGDGDYNEYSRAIRIIPELEVPNPQWYKIEPNAFVPYCGSIARQTSNSVYTLNLSSDGKYFLTTGITETPDRFTFSGNMAGAGDNSVGITPGFFAIGWGGRQPVNEPLHQVDNRLVLAWRETINDVDSNNTTTIREQSTNESSTANIPSNSIVNTETILFGVVQYSPPTGSPPLFEVPLTAN